MAKREKTDDEKKASRLSRRSRAKGRQFEKDIAELLSEWLGLPVSDVAIAGSDSGIDIRLSEEATRRLRTNVYFECKNHKSLKVPEWLKNLENDVKKTGQMPCLVFKTHGNSTPYVVIRFHDYMELMTRHLNEERNGTTDS